MPNKIAYWKSCGRISARELRKSIVAKLNNTLLLTSRLLLTGFRVKVEDA